MSIWLCQLPLAMGMGAPTLPHAFHEHGCAKEGCAKHGEGCSGPGQLSLHVCATGSVNMLATTCMFALQVHEYDEWGSAQDLDDLACLEAMCPFTRLGHALSSVSSSQGTPHSPAEQGLLQGARRHLWRKWPGRHLRAAGKQEGGSAAGCVQAQALPLGTSGCSRQETLSAITEAGRGGAAGGIQGLPAVLVTAALDDSRVLVWGPAKWTARARRLQVSAWLPCRGGGGCSVHALCLA